MSLYTVERFDWNMYQLHGVKGEQPEHLESLWDSITDRQTIPTLWELSEAKHHPALLHVSTTALGSFSSRRSPQELQL